MGTTSCARQATPDELIRAAVDQARWADALVELEKLLADPTTYFEEEVYGYRRMLVTCYVRTDRGSDAAEILRDLVDGGAVTASQLTNACLLLAMEEFYDEALSVLASSAHAFPHDATTLSYASSRIQRAWHDNRGHFVGTPHRIDPEESERSLMQGILDLVPRKYAPGFEHD